MFFLRSFVPFFLAPPLRSNPAPAGLTVSSPEPRKLSGFGAAVTNLSFRCVLCVLCARFHLSSVICHLSRASLGYRLFAKRWLCAKRLFRPESDPVGLIPERNLFSHRASSDIDHPRGSSA